MHHALPTRTVSAVLAFLAVLVGCSSASRNGGGTPPAPAQTRIIVFVWDGLRPDSVGANDTPNLVRLRDEGVLFDAQHATYPTFTMINSASFATGNYPAKTGFYGNYVWVDGPADGGLSGTGAVVDLQQTVSTEDYGVLDALDRFYGGKALLSGTLFEAAQDAGFTTAVVGKVGAAYLQDRRRGGWVLEERLVWPRTLVDAIQDAGLPLPKATSLAYPPGALDAGTADPTRPGVVVRLADGVTSDPTRGLVGPPNEDNAYLMKAFTEVLLAGFRPQLTLIWLRNPDTTEHGYGPGTAAYRDALHAQDALLGQLRAAVERLGLSATTDLLVVSDHAHSSISGPLDLFPLRGIADGGVGEPDVHGYSVSGEVRTADLINRAGLGLRAYDGLGCSYSPVLSGVIASGTTVYPGIRCGEKPGTTLVPRIPAQPGAKDVVVVINGGSENLHVPSRDPEVVRTLVRFLQAREEFGPVFVARRYGEIAGTLPLDAIQVETRSGERTPDLIVSFAWDAEAEVQGMKGTELATVQGYRGHHGSFSSRDVHNTLIAAGPHFRRGIHDTLPTGNVDVAPTVARLLGLQLPGADGRVLEEALIDGLPLDAYAVEARLRTSSTAGGLKMLLPTDPDGRRWTRAQAGTGSSCRPRPCAGKGRRRLISTGHGRSGTDGRHMCRHMCQRFCWWPEMC
jgi:arylsulfatase A-like enzyme